MRPETGPMQFGNEEKEAQKGTMSHVCNHLLELLRSPLQSEPQARLPVKLKNFSDCVNSGEKKVDG